MIQFTKNLLELNPAYNDSIIQFSSDTISGATKAILTIEGMPFLAVPNGNGRFTFNFKDIIKSLINQNRFWDNIVPDLTQAIVYSDPTITKNLNVEIKIFNLTANDSITKNWLFIRGVEQMPNYHNLSQIIAPIRVLLPTNNYIDYSTRYFEGYPFDFSIFGLADGDEFWFKNLTTSQTSDVYLSQDDNAKRIFLSDGGHNTTELSYLINSSNLNKLELYVNGDFVANINIQKIESDCGVYLKFLNSKGGYSYWKFDSIYKGLLNPKTIDDFAGKYDNLQNLTATSHIFGKTATQTFQVNTTFEMEDAPTLSDLTLSPSVWMYLHREPFHQFQAYNFFEVKVSDTAIPNVDTKNSKNKLSLIITMPEVNTISN